MEATRFHGVRANRGKVKRRSMKKRERIDVSGSASSLGNNPFGGLASESFRSAVPKSESVKEDSPPGKENKPAGKRGRVDVIRQKAGRGGKTVTVLTGFKGIGVRELEQISRDLRKACGVGGTLKGTNIEIQGDQCVRALEYLTNAGFRPVRAGG